MERFTASALRLDEDELRSIRKRLYHSAGEGYYIFKRFLAPDAVEHIRNIWSGVDPSKTHQAWRGNEYVTAGCADSYARHPDGSTVFYNFMFAEPLDEITREASVCVHMLRNRLSGRNAFSDLNGPSTAVSYRLTHNKNYKDWIAPHTDFFDYEKRYQKGQYDPSRLQATLFLSKRGVDYQGTGFTFRRNDGRDVRFGIDVDIEPGDLLIWKYVNLHGVSDVTTPDGWFGFMRIIYPIHNLHPPRVASAVSPAEIAGDVPFATLLNVVGRRGVQGISRRLRRMAGSQS